MESCFCSCMATSIFSNRSKTFVPILSVSPSCAFEVNNSCVMFSAAIMAHFSAPMILPLKTPNYRKRSTLSVDLKQFKGNVKRVDLKNCVRHRNSDDGTMRLPMPNDHPWFKHINRALRSNEWSNRHSTSKTLSNNDLNIKP